MQTNSKSRPSHILNCLFIYSIKYRGSVCLSNGWIQSNTVSRPPATIKVDCMKLMWERASAELTSQMQIICSAYCLLTLRTAFSVMVTPCKSNLVFVLSSFVGDVHLILTGHGPLLRTITSAQTCKSIFSRMQACPGIQHLQRSPPHFFIKDWGKRH